MTDSDTMRAVEVQEHGDADVVETVEREIPDPGPGEVRVTVAAAGINFADVMQRRGDYVGGPEPPFVPGSEAAGTIDAVGEGVDREVGDRVVALGGQGYAEYVVAPAGMLFDVPESMDFAAAAGFPVQYLTAHNCLFEWGGLEAGDRVLIPAAAGGVGSAAVQLADDVGAEIFATASTAEKLAFARELGADHTINYEDEEFVAEIDHATDGEGVELALEMVGGETASRTLDTLVHGGRMVTYGAATGEPGRLSTRKLLFNNYEVYGYHLGEALTHDPEPVFEAVERLTELLLDGAVEVQVGRRFPLADAADAHRFVEGRESTGKVVLEP